MKGVQFKAIRHKLNLTQVEMAVALGYEGAESTLQPYIAGMEGGVKAIPVPISRIMFLLNVVGSVPDAFFEREE